MSRLPRIPGIIAAAVAVIASLPTAASLDAADVVSGLQRWLDGTRDLECKFEQTLVSGVLGSGLQEGGRLYLKRPGRMRWEYTRPESKIAILDHDVALLYLPEDEQLIQGGASWQEGLLPALLSGEGRLASVFSATLVASPEVGGNGRYRVRLVPREMADGFEEVTLTVTPGDFGIVGAEVLDAAGNRVKYEFRSVRRNRGVDDERFVLEPPPGTEIVEPF